MKCCAKTLLRCFMGHSCCDSDSQKQPRPPGTREGEHLETDGSWAMTDRSRWDEVHRDVLSFCG